jgi:hypothetical protein
MVDSDLCFQVIAKPFGDLFAYPVLPKGCLNENIQSHNEEKKGQEKPFQYFFKSPQFQPFKL